MKQHKSSRGLFIPIVALVLLLLIGFGISRHYKNTVNNSGPLRVVAAENFWGNLIAQLGGSRVNVTSIVSDPNADPHEYSSNNVTARNFALADYVILNGAGYDSWANKLINASSNSHRQMLTIADILGKKQGDNPHFWYNPTYVNQAIVRMEQDLIRIDPTNTSYYQQQYNNLQTGLSSYQSRIAQIKQKFGGTTVAATEDIFVYLADPAGLNLISPSAFIQAVAEGNDPPTDSVVQFEQQLQSGQVKVLVYNQQTVTPLTDNIKKLAAQQGIPIVGVTETIQPPDTSFQDWMNAELISLENALNAQALGH